MLRAQQRQSEISIKMNQMKWTKSPKRPTHFGAIKLDSLSQILGPEQALHQLYLGDEYDANDYDQLAEKGIKSVLTVASGLGVYYPKSIIANHMVLQVQDQQRFNIQPYFQRAFQFIERARAQSAVLVHCQAGVSRSNTIVCSYLMKKRGLTADQALNFVKCRRKNTHPNKGFLQALKQYQKRVSRSLQLPTPYYAQSTVLSTSQQKIQLKHQNQRGNTGYSSRYFLAEQYIRKSEWQKTIRVASFTPKVQNTPKLSSVRSSQNLRNYNRKAYANYCQ